MDRNSLSLILLLILYIVCIDLVASDSGSCIGSRSESTMMRLKKYLLCKYDPNMRPVPSANNATPVVLYIKPSFFSYEQYSEVFELHAEVSMSWLDTHLTWNRADYDNIETVPVSANEIWVPDILVYNNQESGGDTSDYIKCLVASNGQIHCFAPKSYLTYCLEDITWWPYNIVNCTIKFSSWSHSKNEIDFTSEMSAEYLRHSKNAAWDLLKFETIELEEKYKYNPNSTVKMISYNFLLKRHSGIIHIVFVMPSIALAIMTLMALWLEPKSFERMMIANLNFICHILCIEYVHWEVPSNGSNISMLLTFYESSLVIASFTLILTNILRQLQELTSEPPVWVSTITMIILHSRVGQIFLVSILDPAETAKIETNADDNTDLVQSNSLIKKSPWRYVTVLIGWLAFSSVFLAYIILYSTRFPTDFIGNSLNYTLIS